MPQRGDYVLYACRGGSPPASALPSPKWGKAFYYFFVSGISSVQTPPLVSVTRTTYFGISFPS